MSNTAIIAEYNPFHKGHAYQIEQARNITGADNVIILMSGDFVQRGEPAIMDKYLRTQAALTCGADYVFELPVWIATASARDYAYGAVNILNHFHCIDHLCFGAENDDLELLQYAADFFLRESEEFKKILKDLLKKGISYPRARQEAFEKITGMDSSFLQMPNNILAISYLEALQYFHSDIKPVVIRRIGNYHNPDPEGTFASASAIRHMLSDRDRGFSDIKDYVPEAIYELYKKEYMHSYPVFPESMWPIINYKLLVEADSISAMYDIPEDLSNRIVHFRPFCADYEDFLSKTVSPFYTKSRIRRGLCHIFLDLKKEELSEYKQNEQAMYARLLGMRDAKNSFLKLLKEKSSLCILHKALPQEIPDSPGFNTSLTAYSKDVRAAEIYSMLQHNSCPDSKYIHEFCHKLIKII